MTEIIEFSKSIFRWLIKVIMVSWSEFKSFSHSASSPIPNRASNEGSQRFHSIRMGLLLFESAFLLIGGFAKRAHPARARYLNVNLAWRNRDLQPGGKEIEGGGRGGGGEEKRRRRRQRRRKVTVGRAGICRIWKT